MADPDDDAFRSGRRAAKELLRSHRLERVQERMDLIATVRGPEVRDAITSSLQHWTWDDAKAAWVDDLQRAQQFVANLQRQADIWGNLVCGVRQPKEYVGSAQRQRARLVARTCTILLMLAGATLFAWGMYELMQLVLGFALSPCTQAQLQGKLIETVSLAMTILTTIVAAIIGFFTRASAGVRWIANGLETWLLRRQITASTTMEWNKS